MPRGTLLAAIVLTLLLSSAAYAVRITIDTGGDPNSRLEIRTLTLPDGTQAQLYVLEGHQVHVTIGDSVLVANHVEFDLTNRVVRVVGYGSYTTKGETVTGNDLVIDLKGESFQAKDVIISTSALDVTGDSASRVPGQISVLSGHFSPCSRCDQSIEDYGFDASRIELYPGDRLVAYGVTVLLRNRPLFELPLLVVPLAPPNRQPLLSITTGTATTRAEVAVRWPYVAGPDAFGSVDLHYYADVTPGAGNWLENNLLGGQVTTSYVGGGFDHRFYTERGKGEFKVQYTPFTLDRNSDGTVPSGPKGESTLQFELHYATEKVLGPPSNSFSLTRDDTVRNRIWEYDWSTTQQSDGLQGTFSSQGFLDVKPGDDVSTPSYANRTTPLRTIARLQVQPTDLKSYTFGPFQVQSALLDLGAFEDNSNLSNRSAAATPTVTAGRLLDNYALVMTPASPWAGMTVSGKSVFTGKYYGTGERLVDWNADITAQQSVAGAGSLSLTFLRDTAQGETPFAFDQIPLRTRTESKARLLLDPLAWANLAVTGGYVFVDSRDQQNEPVTSTLTLFGKTPWISASVSNSYDIKNQDPGTIDAKLAVRSSGSVRASLQLEHVEDLKATPDPLTGVVTDETHSQAKASLAYAGVAELAISGGYNYNPPPPPAGEPPQAWDPLDLSVTLGTLQQDDLTPGLKVTYERDLNAGKVTALTVAAAAAAGPLQFSASERLGFPNGTVASSALRLAWPGIAAVEADGLAWLEPSWLGFPGDPTVSRTLSFRVEDAPTTGQPVWQVRYDTVFDPTLNSGAGGYRNTDFTTRAVLTDRQWGPANFSVDLFTDMPLHDDLQPISYLRRGSLNFGLDLYETVGLQGSLGYNGYYSSSTQSVTSGLLNLTDVALIVRPVKSLYLGAVVNDTWDLTGNSATYPSFNLQPTFVVAWNRCCWALYSSWDSATGVFKIALTTPGSSQGLLQTFQSALMLPE
ncbi:MAG: hypothetical protein P8Y13_15160, partial [Deinococcales bacterium]